MPCEMVSTSGQPCNTRGFRRSWCLGNPLPEYLLDAQEVVQVNGRDLDVGDAEQDVGLQLRRDDNEDLRDDCPDVVDGHNLAGGLDFLSLIFRFWKTCHEWPVGVAGIKKAWHCNSTCWVRFWPPNWGAWPVGVALDVFLFFTLFPRLFTFRVATSCLILANYLMWCNILLEWALFVC